MEDAPKRVFIAPFFDIKSDETTWTEGLWDLASDGDGDVEYTRKDIADELADSLAAMIETFGHIAGDTGCKRQNLEEDILMETVTAALAKYREQK